MSQRRFHFDVYKVPLSSQATPPSLTREEGAEVLGQLFEIPGQNAEAIFDSVRKTMESIFKEQFKLGKNAAWTAFQPYRLPVDGLFTPVLLIQYGNSEWCKQIGGNLIVVRRHGGKLPTGMFDNPIATYKAVERLGWAVDPLDK